MVDRIEVKIGEELEIVEHEGKKIKLVAKIDEVLPYGDPYCNKCYFKINNCGFYTTTNNCFKYPCDSNTRSDGKNIYFEEVKK